MIHEKAYLYSLWRGELKIHEGEIHRLWSSDGVCVTNKRNVKCSLEPGAVFNSVLWLPEKDDQRAIEILIAYEENCILLLEEKIVNHRINIGKLKGTYKEF